MSRAYVQEWEEAHSRGEPTWQGWVLPEDEAIKHIKYACVVKPIVGDNTLTLVLRYDAGIQTFDTANVRGVFVAFRGFFSCSIGLFQWSFRDHLGQRDQEIGTPPGRGRYHDQGTQEVFVLMQEPTQIPVVGSCSPQSPKITARVSGAIRRRRSMG